MAATAWAPHSFPSYHSYRSNDLAAGVDGIFVQSVVFKCEVHSRIAINLAKKMGVRSIWSSGVLYFG